MTVVMCGITGGTKTAQKYLWASWNSNPRYHQISGSHGGGYEDVCPLGCCAV
jgi:hypothetical protein